MSTQPKREPLKVSQDLYDDLSKEQRLSLADRFTLTVIGYADAPDDAEVSHG